MEVLLLLLAVVVVPLLAAATVTLLGRAAGRLYAAVMGPGVPGRGSPRRTSGPTSSRPAATATPCEPARTSTSPGPPGNGETASPRDGAPHQRWGVDGGEHRTRAVRRSGGQLSRMTGVWTTLSTSSDRGLPSRSGAPATAGEGAACPPAGRSR